MTIILNYLEYVYNLNYFHDVCLNLDSKISILRFMIIKNPIPSNHHYLARHLARICSVIISQDLLI